MLRKLIKYEFKATGRLLFPLYIVLIIFACINKIFMADMINPSTAPSILGELPKILSMVLYISTMVAIFVVTFFITVQRYYKNLLGDEGYLMNTLPVKPWQNIMSKLLVALAWAIMSVLVALISVFIMAYEKGLFIEIITSFPQLFQSLWAEAGFKGVLFLIQVILVMITSNASSILMVYAAMSIGHLFDKRRILCSFGAFIVLNMITQTLVALVVSPFTIAYSNIINSVNVFSAANILLFIINLGTLIIAAAYFIICNYITCKKLNLE